MDKKPLFNKILATLHKKGWVTLRVVEHEDYIMHTFDRTALDMSMAVTALKEYISANGWKAPKIPVDPDKSESYTTYMLSANARGMVAPVARKYISLIYRPKKDSISLGQMEMGFGWNSKALRYYPLRKTMPLLNYSDSGVWLFNWQKKPRVLKGGDIRSRHDDPIPEHVDWAARDIMGIDYDWRQYDLTWKNFMGTKDRFEAIERAYGVRIPKAMKVLSPKDLVRVAQVINPNDMNKLCQAIAKNPEWSKENTTVGLGTVIATAMNVDNPWVLNDWIDDHVALKQKMNLKISSIKRVQDMHRRMSYARAIKNTKYVKPHNKYKDVLKEIDPAVSVEFIKSKNRLLDETVKMSHCVATYADKINRGESAIFHIEYLGLPYTLEVVEGRNLNRVFGITNTDQVIPDRQPDRIMQQAQLRGYANDVGGKGPPAELVDKINSALTLHNVKPQPARHFEQKPEIKKPAPQQIPVHELEF